MDKEIVFEINDRPPNIILGKNLHIPVMMDGDNDCIDSLLVAMELADDDGFKLPSIKNQYLLESWEYSFYCKINGMTYKITQGKKDDDFYDKIELA